MDWHDVEYERDRERRHHRHRDRDESSRDRDRHRHRHHSRRHHSRERDDHHREKDRYDERDREYRRRDRSSSRDRKRGEDRDRTSSHHTRTTSMFSRPATYDPRLAERTYSIRSMTYSNDDDASLGEADLSRQLKEELGLSSDDEIEERQERNDAVVSDEANAWKEKCENLEAQLQETKENEERTRESLNKLQLLSKSQTAILKTTMLKRLQEKEDQIEEVFSVVKSLEKKLEEANVEYDPYSLPNASVPTKNAKMEAVEEMDGIKEEVERLLAENESLKSGIRSNGNASSDKGREKKLEKEKQALALELSKLKEQLAGNKDKAQAMNFSEDTTEKKFMELEQKLHEREGQIEVHLQTIEALQATIRANQNDSSTTSASNANAEAELIELRSKLALQQKEATDKELQSQERYKKLKGAAETELSKIKEQAKRAIIDLKQRLQAASGRKKADSQALLMVRKELATQKSNLSLIKSHVKQLSGNQFSAIGKQLTAQLTDRVRRQAEAMAGVVENYEREMKERKKLFNLVQELRGNIRVLCRFRPISKQELARGNKLAVSKFTPEGVTVSGDKGKVKAFEFNHVFNVDATQDEVYAEVQPLVTSVLDGYSVCIFAYGQTGSGKTFSMSGVAENPGINPRALKDLFDLKTRRSKEFQDELAVSVMEIYNEQIRDLLVEDATAPNSLSVRQGPNGNYVPGLTTIPVHTLEEVERLIDRGNDNRSTHATDMNEHSSRSHSILSVQLKSTNIVTGVVARGKLFLVDLAGSERLSKTGAEGQRLKEAQNINKSLSALGDVISARANKAKHVPYRNSSLTYLLQDALGGDSKTLMVACASPVDYNSEETFCTLNFAARARMVEMGRATKNVG